MRQIRLVFNHLLSVLACLRCSKPGDKIQKLPQEVLDSALAEARFLYEKHGVDVRSLRVGEQPEIPKPADGSEIPPMCCG